MFERCTEATRRVIFFACYEANLRDAAVISTPYLVLGLMREGHSPVLTGTGLRKGMENCVHRLPLPPAVRSKGDPKNQKDIPLEDDAKYVLAWAAREADKDGNKRIEPEHLLRGLLCFDNATTEILKSCGFDLESLRVASNAGSNWTRVFRRLRWNTYLLLRKAVWPALWRLAVLFVVGLVGVLVLRVLGVG